MNPKIRTSALKQMQGKRSDEQVLLTLRTNSVLGTDEFTSLTAWGGRLLYDNGCMALLYLPVGRVNNIAAWDCVVEVR